MTAPCCNFHTHTDRCDGHGTPREFALAALGKGFSALGFSGHSYLPREDFGLSPEKLTAYLDELNALKREFSGRLEILTGIELDDEAPAIDLHLFDYHITSIHALQSPETGKWYSIDNTPDEAFACLKEGFGGNSDRMAAAYFARVSAFAGASRPAFVGHFDLIRKFNRDNLLLQPDSPAFRRAAQQALERLSALGMTLEVNTSGFAHSADRLPYPAPPLLYEWRRLGGDVIFSADAHAPQELDQYFGEAIVLLRQCGFSRLRVLSAEGGRFIPI